MKFITTLLFIMSVFVGQAQQMMVINSPLFTHSNFLLNDSAFTNGLDSNLLKHTITVNQNKVPVRAYPASHNFKSLLLPATFITYGVMALHSRALNNLDKSTTRTISEDYSSFHSKIDDYLQYAPAFAVYGLNAMKIKGKNNFGDRSAMYGITTLVTGGIVCSIKAITNVQRPDGSAFNSFPSGHTTTAFVAAEFLNQEYGQRSPWYSILGYTAATTTGVMRMLNKRHHLSDIVCGAGIGIVTTKLVYLAYPAVKRKLSRRKSLLAKQVTAL